MNHTVELHITEKSTNKNGSPIFEGWLSGEKAISIFGDLAHTHCAMTSQQAIAYKVAVEKRAWQWSQAYTTVADGSEHPTKIHSDGTPCLDTVTVNVIVDRIS